MFFWELLNLNMIWILLSVWVLISVNKKINLGIPPQLIYMFLWIILVSFGFWVPEKEMQILSGFAIIFMLFTSELTGHSVPHFFDSIFKNIKVAIVAAIGPWIWAYIFSNLWWWSFSESIVLWAVFTATALPFTIWVLKEYKISKSKAANVAISASTADDILATLVWILTSVLLATSWSSWRNYFEISLELWLVIWFFVFIYLLHFLLSKYKLLKKYHWGTLTIMIMWWIIIALWEFIFHIHYAIWALFAWVLLNPEFFHEKLSKFKRSSEKLARTSEYIWPFFFVYLWLNLNFSNVFQNYTILISGFLLFLSVVTLQFLTAYFAWKWRWLDNTNAMTLGFAMTPRDVVAIVIFDMNSQFITNINIFPSVILAIFLLNITATLWLKFSSKKLLEQKSN